MDPEGSLLAERASDGQVSFYTRLHLTTKNGMKLMTVKIDHSPEQVLEAISP